MPTLETQLAETSRERDRILEKINLKNAKRKIQCESCSEAHAIWVNNPYVNRNRKKFGLVEES